MNKRCLQLLNKLEAEGKIQVCDFTFPPKKELQLKLKDMLEDEVDEKYYLSEEKIGKIANWKGFQKPFKKVQGNESVCPTITARGAGEEHNGMITYCDKLDNTTDLQTQCKEYGGTKLQQEVCNKVIDSGLAQPNDVIEYTFSNARLKELEKGELKKQNKDDNTIMSTLVTHPDKLGVVVSSIKEYKETTGAALRTWPRNSGLTKQQKENRGKRIEIRKDKMCNTITTHTHDSLVAGLRIRKLTPKECFRLMGFDDADFAKAEQVCSNSQLYKQAGNSIVVNVLEAIFKELFKEEL